MGVKGSANARSDVIWHRQDEQRLTHLTDLIQDRAAAAASRGARWTCPLHADQDANKKVGITNCYALEMTSRQGADRGLVQVWFY